MSRLELNYNNKKLKERRKELRNNMTAAEVILWERVRRRQIKNIKFRRQFSIENFIVDFYAPEIKLCVEIDGPIHDFNKSTDKNRQEFLQNYGVTFLRFKNDEVINSLELVVVSISNKIDELVNK